MVSKAARRNLEAHIRGESERDIDALMAPLASHPRYVVPGGVLDGRAAVEAMYRKVLPILGPELSAEYLRALDDPAVTQWGNDHCVIEYSDSYPLHCGMVVVVHFENDRIRSENTYFATAERFATAIMADGSAASVDGDVLVGRT